MLPYRKRRWDDTDPCNSGGSAPGSGGMAAPVESRPADGDVNGSNQTHKEISEPNFLSTAEVHNGRLTSIVADHGATTMLSNNHWDKPEATIAGEGALAADCVSVSPNNSQAASPSLEDANEHLDTAHNNTLAARDDLPAANQPGACNGNPLLTMEANTTQEHYDGPPLVDSSRLSHSDVPDACNSNYDDAATGEPKLLASTVGQPNEKRHSSDSESLHPPSNHKNSSSPPLTLYDKLKQRRAQEAERKNQQANVQQSTSPALKSASPGPKRAPTSSLDAKVAARLERVQTGTRLAVYWDGEQAYFSGTVKKIREERKRPYLIVYDDGDREWVDLANENFRLLKKKTKKRDSLSSTGSESELAVSAHAKRKKRNRALDGDVYSMVHAERSNSIEKSLKTSPLDSLEPARESLDAIRSTDFRSTLASSHFVSRTTHSSSDAVDTPQTDALSLTKSTSWVEESIKRSDSDSETDEEEVRDWAAKMFGIKLPPVANPNAATSLPKTPPCGLEDFHRFDSSVQIPISEKVKRRRQKSVEDPATLCVSKKVSAKQKKALAEKEADDAVRRRREANRPLTRDEIQAILRIEDNAAADSSHYVRRSVRQPNRAALNAHGVRSVMEKLHNNDTDMIVLKMKKYINDPDTPPVVIDAVLDALEENTNCEALYIQNFNQGMRDEQVLRLLRILQLPSCNIWCLNIGENYQVKMKTWEKFTNGLKDTKITHMYASEHTITHEIKDQLRAAMRENRKKHDRHNNPDNLDTIIQCTHCWWNPINSKRLQPYLKKRGYDHILMDVEAQGLKGTMTGAFIS